jgi:hypothetical protein
MKREVLRIRISPIKRKMTSEELQIYLREMTRGVGFHSTKKGGKGYNRRRDKKVTE